MATKPKRIQRSRAAGWHMPDNAVYVGRPTWFGNPWPISEDCDAAEAVRRYREWLERPDGPGSVVRARARLELRRKDLVCWCPLDQPCHADVLLEIANFGDDEVDA